MRILVTGASGWLGRHLVPLLRQQGHQVAGMDVAVGPFTDIVGSVADRDAVAKGFAGPRIDGVLHAAALHKLDIARFPRQAFVDVNISGTLNLLEVAAAHQVERFVFTSTTSLMISQAIRDETGDAAVWLDETSSPLEPRNIYGITKLAAEAQCRLLHLETGLPVVILRTARFFPEDDDTLAKPAGENLKINELLNRRLTVEDCARAHLHALTCPVPTGCATYIVSAPTPFMREDAQALKADAASLIRHLYQTRRPSTPRGAGRCRRASVGCMTRRPSFATRISDSKRITRSRSPH